MLGLYTCFVVCYNVLTVPPKTSEQLLEDHFQIDNISSEENIDEDGLVSALLPPKLSYFQFQLSFSANFKNDKNIMNTEIALSTFEGEFYLARIKHHEPALRRVILDTIAETPEEDARTKIGKENLAHKLLSEINSKFLVLHKKHERSLLSCSISINPMNSLSETSVFLST